MYFPGGLDSTRWWISNRRQQWGKTVPLEKSPICFRSSLEWPFLSQLPISLCLDFPLPVPLRISRRSSSFRVIPLPFTYLRCLSKLYTRFTRRIQQDTVRPSVTSFQDPRAWARFMVILIVHCLLFLFTSSSFVLAYFAFFFSSLFSQLLSLRHFVPAFSLAVCTLPWAVARPKATDEPELVARVGEPRSPQWLNRPSKTWDPSLRPFWSLTVAFAITDFAGSSSRSGSNDTAGSLSHVVVAF